jgi:DNA polymerase-1
MAQVDDEFEEMGAYEVCHPLLQIHDELLFEMHKGFAEELGEHVKGTFENCVKLSIPIKAGVAMSENWGILAK